MGELKQRLLGLEEKSKTADSFCVVGRLLSELDDETRDILGRVLKSSASTRSIWLELKAADISVDRGLISTHRQGKCLCIKGDSQ